MRTAFLIITFCFSVLTSFAQQKKEYQSLIYKISTEEYIQLEKGAKFGAQYLHTLVDSNLVNWQIEGLGYYIKAYPKEENLQLEVIANTSIAAILIKNDRDFALKVMDSLGVNLENAQVFWDEIPIPFHKKTKTYRLKKWKEKEGKILVKVKEEAIFFEAEQESNYYYTRPKKLKYFLLGPVRLTKRLWWKAKDIIQYGEWFSNKEYKGYIAFSQPKYRPNDTLKVKAYLTNKKGKSLRRTLEVNLRSDYKIKYTQKVQPTEKGVYILEIPLNDSLDLTLDKRTEVTFEDERLFNKHEVKSHSFYYEDYQLDDVTYSLKSDKTEYEYGDKITVLAEGKFKTGQYIPDGTIRLTVRTTDRYRRLNDGQFFDKEVLLKDTLWTTQMALSSQKPTQILIPSDSIPKVALTVYIDATFTNSNGEIHMESTSFKLKRKPAFQPLELTLEEEFIVAKVKEGIEEQNPTVEWYIYSDEIDNIEATRLVQLPYKERVNGNLSGYDISFPDSMGLVELFLEDEPSNVTISGQHSGNKLNINITNPRRLQLTYQLYKGKKLVEEGQTDQAIINWERNAASNKNYNLKCQYVWAGEPTETNESFVYLKKKLTIEIEQPTTIIPGEVIPIKIKVQNPKNKGVKGVNLTAGATNGKFENKQPFSNIEIPYKQRKQPKFLSNYSLESDDDLPESRVDMSKDWAIKTKVDTQLFYQLRFPETGVYLHYDTLTKDSFYQNITQFSPYLIDKGKAKPIYTIFCNKKLVYYYDVQDDPPYAFVGQAGYNQIQIRTLDAYYDIDSVFLKKGQKLELSIDINNYHNSKNGLKITRRNATNYLLPFERTTIQQSTFMFYPQQGKHHLMQDSSNIHIFSSSYFNNRRKPLQVGPFYPNQNLTYILKDGFTNTFYFEPNFAYQINPDRERLYSQIILKEKQLLPIHLPLKKPAETIYSLSDIEQLTVIKKTNEPKIIFQTLPRNSLNRGKLKFKYEDSENTLLAILWKPQDAAAVTLSPNTRSIEDVPKKYELFLIQKDSSYAKVELKLTANALLFLDLSAVPFQADSLGLIYQQMAFVNPRLFEKIPLDYRQKEAAPPIKLQNISGTIRGTVTDDSGESLIGASVLIKGTTIGTVTDIDGTYTLDIPDGDYELIVSYTGYATQEHHINGPNNEVDIVLSEGLELMEVVVTGLGIKKEKKALSYSVATISTDALQGRVSGVTISEAKKQKRLSLINQNLPQNDQLRSNFQDYAFWQPNLVTDRKGEAHFTAVFPDNLTQWQTFVIGMDKQQRAGVGFAQTNAFKPLIAQLEVPRFLVEGDEVNVIGKSINFTQDSLKINTFFKNDGVVINEKTAVVSDAIIEKTTIQTSLEKDTLTLTYQLKNGDYGDGEERKIPVFKKGISENVGQFYLLDADTTFSIDFPDKNTPITVRLESNLFDLLTTSVDYLIEYPHGCNEQTASKLMAVLLAKELKTIQGQPFKKEKYIRKGIKRLEQAQNENGSWGWFKADQPDAWMTIYVLKALVQAQQAGYASKSIEKGLVYLTNNLPNFRKRDLLNTLELFSDIGQNADYKKWLRPLDTLFRHTDLNAQFTIIKIKQAQNLPHTLDSLHKYQQRDVFGNSYWGKPKYHWYNTDVQISLLAYEIFKKAENNKICREIERYLLREKDLLGWGNTFQTAKVLTVILKNNFDEKNPTIQKDKLILNNGEAVEINQFPFEKTYAAGENIEVVKNGKTPIYFTAYQTYWNKNPIPKSDLFAVKSQLIQNGNPTKNIEATVTAQLEVTVDITRKAEYVMIEIPIPAGCSYGEKIQPRNWSYWRRYPINYEVHREYFKDKVAIYCRELPIGEYTYSINLEPRFTGNYTLNPTKVEEMYFPVFYGRNGMKKVEVRE